ncbi:MAG: hypothetical protein C9356_20330 [Oleiphilus sp.]|nr:MAG: hypothetical protein C9356_20330 [Oleiphilus sp.]
MSVSGLLKKYAWVNIGLASSLVVVMVILYQQGIDTGQHALLCLVAAGFFLGAVGFEAKDIDDAEEAKRNMLDDKAVLENSRLTANPIVSYVMCHLIILAFVIGEAIASTLLIPLIGAFLAAITFVLYLPWLAWRVIKLVRSPSKELKYFDRYTKR